ncbi:GntR family transcriptional regulator [Lacticaseibacillus chiayiensis]|uniref:GntR family transcriptional regulator n=1 Tax=Lacticaseibacillus chiayiensis TaxID=2100821 RepID=UPI003C763131
MYHEIAADVSRAIHGGRLTDKLPTEAELMVQYKVGRNTIRRAIDVVYRSGLLRRIQGPGFYVNRMPSPAKATINLITRADASVDQPEHLTSRVLTFAKILADNELAKALHKKEDSRLYRVVRLSYLEERLYCLEETY